MNFEKAKKPLAFLMAALMLVTSLGGPIGATAAEAEGIPDARGDLVLYDEKERTDLEADEIATAENINVLKDSDYDVTDVRDGISFHEDKVAVSYYADRSDFDLTKAGVYDTYYVAEPLSGKKGYLIHRTDSCNSRVQCEYNIIVSII